MTTDEQAIRAEVERQVQATVTHWRSMDDGALDIRTFTDLLVNRFTAALAAAQREREEAIQRMEWWRDRWTNEQAANTRLREKGERLEAGLRKVWSRYHDMLAHAMSPDTCDAPACTTARASLLGDGGAREEETGGAKG